MPARKYTPAQSPPNERSADHYLHYIMHYNALSALSALLALQLMLSLHRSEPLTGGYKIVEMSKMQAGRGDVLAGHGVTDSYGL